MNASHSYNVVLTGQCDQPQQQVIQALSQLFAEKPEVIQTLLDNAPVIIKKELDELTARKYRKAIVQIGAVVELETIENPAHAGWELEPTADEQKQKPIRGKATYEAKDIEP